MDSDKNITIGKTYPIHPNEHSLGCVNRRLIFENNRPIGHYSSGNYQGIGYLWLQNYLGYYHESSFQPFKNIEDAIDYIKTETEIIKELKL